MYKEIVEKIAEMRVGDEFDFVVRSTDDSKDEYPVRAKCICEFSSIIVLVGAIGGGFNMAILANDNMADEETYMNTIVYDQITKCFAGYEFVGFETENGLDGGCKMSKFKIGDKVTYTNPNGVVFPGHTVTGFCDWAWGTFNGRIFIDSDSPWFPVEEMSLALESESPDSTESAIDHESFGDSETIKTATHLTPIDLWMSHGQKVRIKSDKAYLDGRIGIIDHFYWVTGEYIVWLEDDKSGFPIPLTSSELEKVA